MEISIPNLPIDGNVHGYEGEVVLYNAESCKFSINHSKWIGEDYEIMQNLGYTHWSPLLAPGQTLTLSDWNPPHSVPMDGTEVLIKTSTGVVSAWYASPREVYTDNGTEYEGSCFVCYDDEFEIEVECDTFMGSAILGWMHIPK